MRITSRSLLLCGSFLAALAMPSPSPGAPREINAVAATVNGRVVTESEVRLMMAGAENMLRAEFSGAELERRLKEAREGVLQDLIDREIILGEFEGSGGSISEEYIDQEIDNIIRRDFDGDRQLFFEHLRRGGITNRKFREITRKSITVQALRGQALRNLPPPRPDEVRAAYDEMAKQFRNEGGTIQYRKIFIPRGSAAASEAEQRELAREIRTQLLQGADFASLARQYSRDARADAGGEWPVMERRFLRRDLADAAFATPVGELSPLVEDESGWHIILVEAKETANPPPFEELREQAARLAENRNRAAANEKWIGHLREKAVIKRF